MHAYAPATFYLTPSYFSKVLEAILSLLGKEMRLNSVVVDYEKSMWAALRLVLPEVDIKGCLFHFNQALYQKVQEIGLQVGNTPL